MTNKTLHQGALLNFEWYKSPEGINLCSSLMIGKASSKRKTFALLEKPNIPANMEEFRYKVFLVGKSGVGKTSTQANLSGNNIPVNHYETAGMQMSTIYWPVKMTRADKIVLFHIELWDAGENSLKKFDHIHPACTEKLDAFLFLFSFIDKSSFESIPSQISRVTTAEDDTAKLVLGTKFDHYATSEISQRDIRAFEQQWDIPVLKIRNISSEGHPRNVADVAEVAPVLNALCEHLWQREIRLSKQNNKS